MRAMRRRAAPSGEPAHSLRPAARALHPAHADPRSAAGRAPLAFLSVLAGRAHTRRRRRHEFEEHVAKKDAEQLRASQEHGKLLELFAALRAEFDKASSENAVLKRAVSIQHKKQTSADAQLQTFVEAGTRAAAYVKQLEQTNYALRAHLSQMSGSAPGNAFGGRPPDVC
jgi:hypothetical protein